MCTLAFAFQTDRRWPLLVAANRDERLGRPSEGWALRGPSDGPAYLAPRDLLAGGTWIGLSAAGVLAAVTNFRRPDARLPDPALRTRGGLVALALRHRSAAAAREAIGGERPGSGAALHNPFHLLVADLHDAFLWRWDGEREALDRLDPGLHVVTEEAAEDRGPRGERVRARWPLDPVPERLSALLAQHAPGREGICIHADPLYGTRSSAVLRLAPSLEASDLFTTEQHPCLAPFEDRGALLIALARASSP